MGAPECNAIDVRYRPETGQVIYYGRQRGRSGESEASPARIFPALDFPAALCTHVPDSRQQLLRFYATFSNARRVSAQAPAGESALLGVRTRLDRSLPDDGNRRLDCLATTGIQGGRRGSGNLCASTRAQCRMVAPVLRPAQSFGRACGHHPLVGSDYGDDCLILEDLAVGCGIVRHACTSRGRWAVAAQRSVERRRSA